MINFETKIQRVLIICPATLKYNWKNELRTWLVRDLSVEVADSKCFPSSDVVIINFDILHKFEKSLSLYWDLIVIDEAHYLVNHKARRTKCIFGYRPTKKEIQKLADEKGFSTDQAREALTVAPINSRRKLAMTGTPMVNKPADLFPIINWLDPEQWPNGFKFMLRYCAGHQSGFGWDFSGTSNLEELNRELRGGLMLRRLKRDVLKDMPGKWRRVVELPNTAKSKALIEEEWEQFNEDEEAISRLEIAAELAKAGDDEAAFRETVKALNERVQAKFDEMALIRHQTAQAKLPQVIEKLKEIFEEDAEHKLIVFAHHRDVIFEIKREFPQACVVIGGVGAEQKMKEVARFQNDPKATLFIGGLRAAAEGITLTASSHVIFIEEDWTPGKMLQAEDRAHRIGQHDNVLVEHWVLAGSLDVRMAQRTIAKQELMDKVLDERQKMEVGEGATVPAKIVVTVEDEQAAKQTATFAAVAKAAEEITPAQIQAVHQALRMLAGCDNDRASVINGQGFNKLDGTIGHSLAEQARLTPKQAVLGRRIACKYGRQIGQELVNQMKGAE